MRALTRLISAIRARRLQRPGVDAGCAKGRANIYTLALRRRQTEGSANINLYTLAQRQAGSEADIDIYELAASRLRGTQPDAAAATSAPRPEPADA